MNQTFAKALEDDRTINQTPNFIGLSCKAFWTNSGNFFYSGTGKLVKINNKTVLIELTEPVPSGRSEGYPVGSRISVPRTYNRRWSVNNRFEIIR